LDDKFENVDSAYERELSNTFSVSAVLSRAGSRRALSGTSFCFIFANDSFPPFGAT